MVQLQEDAMKLFIIFDVVGKASAQLIRVFAFKNQVTAMKKFSENREFLQFNRDA